MTGGTDKSKSNPLGRPAAPPERRRFARYAVRLPLELHADGSDVPIRVETTDISRNGCYVESNITLAVGTRVRARLWLGETGLTMRGRVVTAHPQYGNGIMFLDYEGDAEQRLKAFLDTLKLDLMEGYCSTPIVVDRFKI